MKLIQRNKKFIKKYFIGGDLTQEPLLAPVPSPEGTSANYDAYPKPNMNYETIKRKHKFLRKNMDEFVEVLYPAYEKAFEEEGLPKELIPYAIKIAANESSYGTNPRGNGFNLGGIKWQETMGNRGKTLHTDGEYYANFNDLYEFAKYHVNTINSDKYDYALSKPISLRNFIAKLHGKNKNKVYYSKAGRTNFGESYYNVVVNMKSLDKALSKYLSGKQRPSGK